MRSTGRRAMSARARSARAGTSAVSAAVLGPVRAALDVGRRVLGQAEAIANGSLADAEELPDERAKRLTRDLLVLGRLPAAAGEHQAPLGQTQAEGPLAQGQERLMQKRGHGED